MEILMHIGFLSIVKCFIMKKLDKILIFKLSLIFY